VRPTLPALVLILGLSPPAAARTYIWLDGDGITHVTDHIESVPPSARKQLVPEGEARGRLWDDGLEGPQPSTTYDGTHSGQDRARRLVHGALGDLERGETARAAASLAAALELAPNIAEAHWYLALLEQQRGHLNEAESHLRDFLATAGEDLSPWRASAERRLAALSDEARLAEPASPATPLALVAREHPRFRLELDPALVHGDSEYLSTVLRYLEEARSHGVTQLGVEPAEATGVVLYGKAAYLQAHRHRFSFQTVGFFDGRIHVVSAAHPAGELRALLYHEFTHALFREQTGGDQPYWLNEGLAELAGRTARSQEGLSGSERETLRTSIEDGGWIPLEKLSAGFSGLTDAEARSAYLESTAAAEWMEARMDVPTRASLLHRLGQGEAEDEVLRSIVGRDTRGIDAAVRAEIVREFPAFAP